MAVQALAIVIRFIQLDIFRRGRLAEVIDIHMSQTMHFRFKRSEHRIVGVARKTGMIGGHTTILRELLLDA